MKMKLLFVFGGIGFHKFMSFLGPIGKVIDVNGLGTALETVYAPVTVDHMFSGKVYAQVVRGHLCASAVLFILLTL